MLRRVALATTALIYIQILLGAAMRHTGAGLAIPDFPLAFGRLVPHVWNAGVAIHYAHRVGALIVTLAVVALAGHVFRHHRPRRELTRPTALLLLCVAAQITLGAFVILSGRQAVINTAHVVNGAVVLVTSLVLTLRSFRTRFAPGDEGIAVGVRVPKPKPELTGHAFADSSGGSASRTSRV
jgi:cytochrome c oxidase assembly protein subunit 15